MEFQEIISQRRSIRKFSNRPVPEQVIRRLIEATLAAPSSRNTRSSELLVVDDPLVVTQMAGMRDYGSAFMAGAPLAIVVLGNTRKTDLWQVNAAISATVLQLACVDEGLASCWVHVADRPRRKDEPQGEQAADFLRTFLPIPDDDEPLCAIVIGYSDVVPAPLPPADDQARVIRLK